MGRSNRGDIFLDQESSRTGMVQRLLLFTRPMESLLDLGMSLPSTMGHSDYEMPPKHDQICGSEGALLTGS